jgi:hypothetical protein
MMRNHTKPAPLLVATVLLVGFFTGTCVAALAAPVLLAHDGCIALKGEAPGSHKIVLAGHWVGRLEAGVLPLRLAPSGYAHVSPDPDVRSAEAWGVRCSRAPPIVP